MGYIANKITTHHFKLVLLGDVFDENQLIATAKRRYLHLQASLLVTRRRNTQRHLIVANGQIVGKIAETHLANKGCALISIQTNPQQTPRRIIHPGDIAPRVRNNRGVTHRFK